MSADQLLGILARRWRSLLVVFVLCSAAVVAATLSLPKTYRATATLFIGETAKPEGFVDSRLVEQHARTYSTLAANPNTATAVSGELGGALGRDAILGRMTFTPIERTQLLQLTAEGPTAPGAQELANAYATVFVSRMSSLYAAGRAPAPISLSEAAVLPAGPASPNVPLYVGFGVLLSLFLALALALLRERLDTRLRVSPADAVVLDQPVVARIPPFAGRDLREGRGVADRFGILKTNLDFFDESPARVVVVTSGVGSEGKSTVSAHLALAAAADGERVVLIEADLRRPGFANTPIAERLDRSQKGLSNYLVGAAAEQEILHAHPDHPNLSVIWSGVIPPNPAALLGSSRLDALLRSLRERFDRVVIDTCPISVAADASVIASRVDGALYVIDERSTRRTDAVAGLNQLLGVRARLLGVVLNRSEIAGTDGYYYADGDAPKRRAGSPERSESFS